MRLAPIVLFVYNRLDCLQETILSLSQNHLAAESDIYIFSDGAKSHDDELKINRVRSYLKTIYGFKTIKIIESPINKGLASSIIDGVSLILKKHDCVIVMEDDLKTTPDFIKFMNDALNNYKVIENVFSISGFSFNLGVAPQEQFDTYLLNRGWSWGWATWKDRWELVDWTAGSYSEFKNNKKSRRKFSLGGSDLNSMLDKQMNNKIDSWAIRWFYHQYIVKGLTLYPIFSKVINTGFGADATHTKGSDRRYIPLIKNRINFVTKFRNENFTTAFYQRRFLSKMGFRARIVSRIFSLIGFVINK